MAKVLEILEKRSSDFCKFSTKSSKTNLALRLSTCFNLLYKLIALSLLNFKPLTVYTKFKFNPNEDLAQSPNFAESNLLNVPLIPLLNKSI